MSKKVAIPPLPTAKTEYSPLPTPGEVGKNDKSLKDLTKKQSAFISQGSGKPQNLLDNSPVRIGFTLSGEQKNAFKLIQDKLPKKPGKKISISYQDYLSQAFDEKLRQDAKKYGIQINSAEEEE